MNNREPVALRIHLQGGSCVQVIMEIEKANDIVRKVLTGEYRLKGPPTIGEIFPVGQGYSWSVKTDEIAAAQIGMLQTVEPHPSLHQTHTSPHQGIRILPGSSGL